MTRRTLRNWAWTGVGFGVIFSSINPLVGVGVIIFVIGLFALVMSYAVSSLEGDDPEHPSFAQRITSEKMDHEDVHVTQTLHYRGLMHMMRKVSYFLLVSSVIEGFLVGSGWIATVLILVGFAGITVSGFMNFVAHPVLDKNGRRIP